MTSRPELPSRRMARVGALMEVSMDSDRWRRVESVLDRALMSDPSNWPELLDDSCSGDPELRAEVEALLAQRSAAEQFLASPPVVAASALVAETKEAAAVKVDYCTTLPPAM